MMISAFPKIFAVGTSYIGALFDDEVEITEKIDGSQFVFGRLNGELQMRSKGAMIEDWYGRKENDLFYPAIQHVLKIQDAIPNDTVFYCETLCKPKHNTLTYVRTPLNNLALYAVRSGVDTFVSEHAELSMWAEALKIEVVPLLAQGKIDNVEGLHALLDNTSVLGGPKIEGFVVKNYKQPFLLGGQPIPVMCGKYVSEAFKEVHRKTWTGENTGRGKWGLFKAGYKTHARWDKAVQHCSERGVLQFEPRDIPVLLKELKDDIEAEEKQVIMEFLWKEFGSEVLREATKGFPEYYKSKLLERAFIGQETNSSNL